MDPKSIILSVLGLLVAGSSTYALALYYIKSWIAADCAEQGPDYIHAHIKGRLGFILGVSFAVLFLFIVLDVLFFRRNGMLVDSLRRVVPDWGDRNAVAWPLWIGACMGVLAGTFLGGASAVRKFPKSRCIVAHLVN